MLRNTLLIISCLILTVSLFSEEFPIATGSYSQTYPEITFDGEDYFVVFVDKRIGSSYYGFYGKKVTPEGDLVPGEIELVPAHNAMSFMHHIARGDDQYLFAWSRQRDPYNYTRDTYARRLDGSGQPIGTSFRISIGNTASASFIRIGYDGENYLVIWQEGMPTQGAQIRGQFVSPTGSMVGQNFSIRPDDLPADVAQIYPDIVFDGTNYFVVWDDSRTGSRCVYGQFISPDGDFVGDNIVISTEPVDQMLVQTAFNGTHFLVIWADGRHSSNDKSVYGQLLDLDGNLVGEHIPISIVYDNIEKSWPSLASNGNQFLVAWRQDLYSGYPSYQLSPEQELINTSAGIEVSSRQYLWYDVYGRMINPDGSFATDEFVICDELFHQDEQSVASDMENFLVAWEDSRNQNQYYDIYGLIVEGETAPEFYPPQNPAAELSNINEIYISWEEPLPSDFTPQAYRIYENEELIAIGDPEILHYTTEGRDNGLYSYYITAIYEDIFESEPSETVEITVTLLPPDDFLAELEDEFIFCSWQPPVQVRGLSGYKLYRNDTLLIELTETQYLDEAPEIGLNSYFVTALYDDLYESIASDTVDVWTTDVTDTDLLPAATALHQNFPNPFNPETTLYYTLSEQTLVEIAIFDLKGRVVRKLLSEIHEPGEHSLVWDGRNDQDRELPSGIYFSHMRTESFQATRKMLLLK